MNDISQDSRSKSKLLRPARQAGLVYFVITLVFHLTAVNASSELNGEELMQKRKAFNSGWHSSEAHITMTLINAADDSTVRKLRTRALEVKGDGDKSLTIFDQPRDVSGVAFLSHSHVFKADDQWLYLPSFKRIKRISSNNKSGSFMGSEFSFEDMASFEVEKYHYPEARTAELNGEKVFIVTAVPVDKNNSGYSKIMCWLSATHYQPLKVEYYDKKSALLKTLEISDFKQHPGDLWRGHRLHMENAQTGKQTVLLFEDIEFKLGYDDADFRKNILDRVY